MIGKSREKAFEFEDAISVSGQITWDCPKHGKVTRALHFEQTKEEKETLFCGECWREFFLKHVTVVKETND